MNEPYRIWLSRRRNGNYLLTKIRPMKHDVRGLGVEDYYVPYGDPMGLDNCCPAGVMAIFGIDLAVGEQCKALMQGERLGTLTLTGTSEPEPKE